MKRSFFQAAVTSILLYGCTTWTLTKRLEKKLDGNYTRMLRAILNKSWQQHPTRHQLYGHLPPITKTIQVRRIRHAGHCCRSRDEPIRDVLLWIPTHGRVKAGRPARTYIHSYVRIQDVVLKTYLGRWTIGRSGERGSEISVLPARYDDDDEITLRWNTIRYNFSSRSVGWSYRLHQLHFWRTIIIPQRVSWNDTNQSDGETWSFEECWLPLYCH